MTGSAPEVELVDADGTVVGRSPKLDAHVAPGALHRALSAFVLDSDQRLLLQRRADGKYHFAGLWSNTCCTHPGPGEDVRAAGERRLREELGITCRLTEVGVFTYRAVDPASGLVEHELDHVLVGHSDDEPEPDPAEVAAVDRVPIDELARALARSPEGFTPWLPPALAVVRRSLPLPSSVPP